MDFDKFVEETRIWWSEYFRTVIKDQIEGRITAKSERIFFPNILLVTNCSGYYVAEFIGASEKFEELSIKIHKEKSIYRYLSQFDDKEPDAILRLDAANICLSSMCLAHDADFNALKERFPQIDLYRSGLNRVGGRGSSLGFGENFVSCMIENSILVNRSENVFRCKSILSACIVSSTVNKDQLIDLFVDATGGEDVWGVFAMEGEDSRLVIAEQLQSMFLFPNLRETTIGEFIIRHPDIVKKAFKTDHFEYEPYLEWLEHDGTCEDRAINPDLLVKREDGFYDIYDLKTALLDKRSITKKGRNRRQFIDCIEDGISQLANYREYFEYPKNAALAKNKYGIEVKDPKLVLIVGSWENVDIDAVNQACRKHKNASVIDYDTLCHMFRGAL